MTAYNDAPFARYVCGQTIGPGEAATLSSDCESRIAHVLAPGDDEVVVVPQGSSNAQQQLETIEDCDVPCQFDRRILHAAESSDVAVLTVFGTDWTVTQTKADPYYQAAAKMERIDYRRHHYYSTTSLLSSVPLSFYDSTRYSLRHAAPAIDFEAAGAKATYLIDKECAAGRRNKWLAAVEAAMEVESFGSCGNNADPKTAHGDLHTLEGRRALMQRNRIVLAFEGRHRKGSHHTRGVGSPPVGRRAGHLRCHKPRAPLAAERGHLRQPLQQLGQVRRVRRASLQQTGNCGRATTRGARTRPPCGSLKRSGTSPTPPPPAGCAGGRTRSGTVSGGITRSRSCRIMCCRAPCVWVFWTSNTAW